MTITWIDDTIETTPTGWYIVNYEVNDINGTRFTRTKFAEESDAQAWINAMRIEHMGAVPIDYRKLKRRIIDYLHKYASAEQLDDIANTLNIK